MKLKIVILFFFTAYFLNAQSCGFGCLGFSGAFGGYTIQQYKAEGVNNAVKLFRDQFKFSNDRLKFKQGKGFKVGANIFRANFTGYFLTAKAFYQFLKEENKIFTNQSQGATQESYTLKLNHWGVGVDFGIPLFNFLDFKIVEGGVTFFKSSLENKITQDGKELSKIRFDNPKIDIGYYVGTGIILHLIRDYVSIEGTAFYHKMEIKEMVPDKNGDLFSNINNSYINQGGFGADVQLNVGFPL